MSSESQNSSDAGDNDSTEGRHGILYVHPDDYTLRSPIQAYCHDRIAEVLVTHVAEVGHFFGFVDTDVNQNNYVVMAERLAQEAAAASCSDWLDKESAPTVGDVYGAKSEAEADGFFRCQIMEVSQVRETVKVCYIDYGDCAVKAKSDLFQISNQLKNVPIVCKSFRMAGIRSEPFGNATELDSSKNANLKFWLSNTLCNQVATIIPRRSNVKRSGLMTSSEPPPFVLVFMDKNDVINDLKKEREKIYPKQEQDYLDEWGSQQSAADDWGSH